VRTPEKIYEELYELGLCHSERDVGKLFGRSESWWSSTKSRKRGISIESTINLLINVEKSAESTMRSIEKEEDKDERMALNEGYLCLQVLRNELYEEIFKIR